MELIERAGFLSSLQTQFERVADGEGHCVFISGEAGIGKTSLVNAFRKEHKTNCHIYQGTCDALFTPRPLAPLYDIATQIRSDFWDASRDMTDRARLFARFFQALEDQSKPVLLVFEDIHWADEATLDFIKFLARRITQLQCLFILTFRDDEIQSHHPLRNVLGQVPADFFTRLQLTPLSREVVEKLAAEKGYNGEDVYGISGGNPFYVNEILASYSTGVPDNIKDSILSVYHRQVDTTKHVWEVLSVLPTGLEIKYLEKLEPSYAASIESCLASKILELRDGVIVFKHELYRRTIEGALSPLLRISLNKKILDLFRESFEHNHQTERIIHHAKNANEYDLVEYYAPWAAERAAAVGAHIEACKLYYTAIEYYQGNNKSLLVKLYEAYAYECYLTNRIKEGIVYQGKALKLWQEKGDTENTGNCMRFLSRLWWYGGNRKQAELFAAEAIEVLADQPASKAKAMAFSNMSQLNMLADQSAQCIHWGEQAIAIAIELDDQETLCHALNNVGTAQLDIPASKEKGIELLQQSLAIALKHSFHEHVARAYTNLGSTSIKTKNYTIGKKILDEGIHYCEERDLNAWAAYMSSWKARFNLENGHWDKACDIADNLLNYGNQTAIIAIAALVIKARINMRRGVEEVLPLLMDAKAKAFDTIELQRIIPVLVALLEYEWITGKEWIEQEALDTTIGMISQMGTVFESSEFAYWLFKVRKQEVKLRESFEGYDMHNGAAAAKAAGLWKSLDCPYEEALALFEGDDEDKRKAITIVHELGATAVYEKMKQDMRASGIKSIPRGIRKSTQANPALLTGREVDVLQLLKEGMQNKEIAARLFISAKTVDHHISAILFKLEAKSRGKAVQEAVRMGIVK